MSLVDDEKILIGNIKDSVNFIDILEEILTEYSITGHMHNVHRDNPNLLMKLPYFETHRWSYCADNAIALYDNIDRRPACTLCFYMVKCGDHYAYECCVELLDAFHRGDVLNKLNVLFKLSDENLWERKPLIVRPAGVRFVQYKSNNILVK
jgi:hypothetical protein